MAAISGRARASQNGIRWFEIFFFFWEGGIFFRVHQTGLSAVVGNIWWRWMAADEPFLCIRNRLSLKREREIERELAMGSLFVLYRV